MVKSAIILLGLFASASAEFHSVNCPLLSYNGETPNTLVFSDFSAPSSDVEGQLFVGGDATLKGYSIGEKVRDDGVDALVVGGDLEFDTGTVFGSVKCAGACNLRNTAHSHGKSNDPNRFNFTGAQAYFELLSRDLAQQKGTDSFGGTQNGKMQRYSYFSMDCDNLANIKSMAMINIPEDGLAVMNLRGTECSWETFGVTVNYEQFSHNVLFNFPQATSIRISEAVVPGSILAPYADVQGHSGVINGALIAKSFTGTTQQNLHKVTPCFDNNELVVQPEFPTIDIAAVEAEAEAEAASF